ncbi:unnamed protein product [Rhizoctonia solani]|uniref:AMP-dependent synthetase/ligase domain-containing protein n=1 Tax=Rhizoctonia solani TaxID=456999 RepID=A0A8H3G6A8_9AGAM|nr:unnamed protein product [Rhizoctonia solani]
MVLTPSFVAPPTDGSVPPALAVDFHHRHNPHHVFTLLYHSATFSQTQVTYEQLACAVHRVAYILNPDNAIPQGTNVGLLVSTSSLEYIIVVLGAMRAGLVPFPISPRVHPSGITHLLTTTRTSLVLAGGNDTIDSTTAQLSAILNESNFNVKIIELSILGDILSLIKTSKVRFKPFPSLGPVDKSSIVTVLHSSGSTGMPKAIKYHLEGVVKNIINKPHGWAASELVGTMALPTFHCLGMVIQVLEPLYMGYTQVLFAPARVPVVPNPNSTLKAIEGTKCTFLVCVPAFLEAWARDEDAIAILKHIKGIMFGGGPLTDAIGNELVNRGVRIYSGFGGTEFGSIHVAPPHEHNAQDWPWNYFKVSPRVKVNFVAQNDQDNTFELEFEAGEKHHPFVLNSELNGKATYKTRDLLTPHPSKSDFWKFIGRVDDQVALLNGEKINPRPMEAEIVKCPIIQSAVVFGQARNQTGVLIELKETLPGTENKRKELVGILWPYFQRANQSSPTHSRLDKRAVVFVDPARPLPRAPKGTIIRSAALKLYAPDIEEMYAALEKDSDTDILDDAEPPEEWADPGVVTVWISGLVKSILGKDIDSTMDLFQQGMDSVDLKGSFDPCVNAIVTEVDRQVSACEDGAQLVVTLGDLTESPYLKEALKDKLQVGGASYPVAQ